jgi:hypothetical protein
MEKMDRETLVYEEGKKHYGGVTPIFIELQIVEIL